MAPELDFDDEGRPVLITRAEYSYEEQHRARVRKYLKIMFWRIPAFLAAAVDQRDWLLRPRDKKCTDPNRCSKLVT